MKILMLTPYLPFPPSSGGQVRSYNLIRILAKKHEITLFCLVKEEKERRFVKELEKYCSQVKVFNRPAKPWTFKNIIRTGFGKYPFLVIRNFSDEEKRAMKSELDNKKYDLIHAENFYVMPHIPKTNVPILLMEQTIFYKVYKHFSESLPWFLFFLKLPLLIDVAKLKYWEFYYWKKADIMAAVSEEDGNLVKKSVGRKDVVIVPNGVDFSRFGGKIYKKEDKPTILFGVADFHWMQNKEGVVNLIDEVWPIIKDQIEDARLWIVGKIAPKALSEFRGLKDVIIQEIDDNRKAYQKSWILVAPIRSGGGSRTKFFEAMASGLPILTTPEGIEGIPAKIGQDVLVENDFSKIASKAITLLTKEKYRQKISNSAKLFVKKNYDWQESARKLDKLYKEVLNDKKN